MGLTRLLLRVAAGRPRLLIVCPPGTAAQRFEVEEVARERGWQLASGPADTDLLIVCAGTAGLGAGWQALLDELWSDIGAPRARVDLEPGGPALPALLAGTRRLADEAEQRHEAGLAAAGGRRRQQDLQDPGDGMDMGDDMGDDMDMDMSGPVRGLPMAGTAPDRDGLALDELHVTLGPVLPAWPHGLRLRVALQGDLVTAATADVIGAAPPGHDEGPAVPAGAAAGAMALDALATLLTVLGASDDAARTQVARDAVRHDAVGAGRQVARLARRLHRRRLLASATRDLGRLQHHDGAPGDALTRWQGWLAEAAASVDADELAGRRPAPARPSTAALLEVLPTLVVGLELGAVRVVVASLGLHLGERAPSARTPAGAAA